MLRRLDLRAHGYRTALVGPVGGRRSPCPGGAHAATSSGARVGHVTKDGRGIGLVHRLLLISRPSSRSDGVGEAGTSVISDEAELTAMPSFRELALWE